MRDPSEGGWGRENDGRIMGCVVLKLPKPGESLPGKDLKDLTLPRAKGKEIKVVGCCAETVVPLPSLNLIKRRRDQQ